MSIIGQAFFWDDGSFLSQIVKQEKNTNGFSDLISDAVFGFSYLTYLGSGFSSIWAAITRLHSQATQAPAVRWSSCAITVMAEL